MKILFFYVNYFGLFYFMFECSNKKKREKKNELYFSECQLIRREALSTDYFVNKTYLQIFVYFFVYLKVLRIRKCLDRKV